MLINESDKKLVERIKTILKKSKVSDEISYSMLERNNRYQCVIKYQKDGKWEQFWVSTGFKIEKGNLRNAKKRAEEIADIFKDTVKENNRNVNNNKMDYYDFQSLADLNTTNYKQDKVTKADWDFYEYMEYWLYNIIQNAVAKDTFVGYKNQVTKRLKDYFTMPEHKKKVKEITADDLDDFYDHLRQQGLKNATIDKYNDNISSAYKFLLRKKLVRYNPTDMVNPIVVEVLEFPTYNKNEILQLFEILKGDPIEIPTLIDGYYGLRRSEIIGLRTEVFDFENNNFTVNHVALQAFGKENKEKVYFEDRIKSKKGCRTLPLFPEVKQAILEKLERIERNKKLFGNTYNHKYDGYICVQDNGDLIQPGYFTHRFAKIIKRNNLRKITPHRTKTQYCNIIAFRRSRYKRSTRLARS